MEIYTYKANIPNLGDDLNPWLWKKVLPSSFLSQEGTLVGIGSVIHPGHFSKMKNPETIHLLGAGCRNKRFPLEGIHQNLKFHFVRGPLSAKALQLSTSKSLLDGAYALMLTDEYKELIRLPKKHKFTLITYFRSKDLIHYPLIGKMRNVNILHSSDYGSIIDALKVIAQSEYVISESLHGAILSDALRVPWARLNYFLQNPRDRETAEFKWEDWLQSLSMKTIPTLHILFRQPKWMSARRNALLKTPRTFDYLSKFNTTLDYELSSENILRDKIDRLGECIHNLAT